MKFHKVEIYLLILAIGILSFILIKGIRILKPELSDSTAINVEDIISNIKTQLQHLEQRTRDSNEIALFKVDKFTLEINFVVKNTTTNSAGAKAEVVTINNSEELSKEMIQKITLEMSLVGPDHVLVPVDNF